MSVRGQLETLAKAFKKAGKHANCALVLGALEAHTPPVARAVAPQGIASLRLKGANGFALFYGPHRQQYFMPMAQEGGAWKVGQIAPVPYPPGSGGPSRNAP
jgi:hypothetical protein